MQLEIGGQKIQECQEALEKTWSVAREEAAKRKAANEIIKVLALKVIYYFPFIFYYMLNGKVIH